MDYRERLNPFEESIKASLDGRQADIHTASPGIIQSFDPAAMTAVVQPATQAVLTADDGTTKNVNLPLLLDVPVQFASGGGVTATFPIAKGDECLIVFAHRCIDAWHQSGGVQAQAELRMHDPSDGFCIPGIRSKPRVLTAFSTTSAQLRSDDGTTYVDLNPTTQMITFVAPGGLVANAGGCTLSMLSGLITLQAEEIVTIGTTRLNNGTHAVAYRGGETVGGDTIADGAVDVFT